MERIITTKGSKNTKKRQCQHFVPFVFFVVSIRLMAKSKHEIRALLAGAGTEPRHRFGQNFMIDQNLVRLVADAGQIAAGDLVVEVGPGTGTLTEEILSRGAEVVAVE